MRLVFVSFPHCDHEVTGHREFKLCVSAAHSGVGYLASGSACLLRVCCPLEGRMMMYWHPASSLWNLSHGWPHSRHATVASVSRYYYSQLRKATEMICQRLEFRWQRPRLESSDPESSVGSHIHLSVNATGIFHSYSATSCWGKCFSEWRKTVTEKCVAGINFLWLGNGVRHLDQVTSAVWISASVLPPRKLTSGQTPSRPALASWKSRPLCLQSERL